jgi:pyrroline-5-carboxylate reductase
LNTLGQEITVEDEDYLDMATALQRHRSAYVFLFMEAPLIRCGRTSWLFATRAEQLVNQTMLDRSNMPPSARASGGLA